MQIFFEIFLVPLVSYISAIAFGYFVIQLVSSSLDIPHGFRKPEQVDTRDMDRVERDKKLVNLMNKVFRYSNLITMWATYYFYVYCTWPYLVFGPVVVSVVSVCFLVFLALVNKSIFKKLIE